MTNLTISLDINGIFLILPRNGVEFDILYKSLSIKTTLET